MGKQVAARFLRGYSSVGRAPALQAGGQGFESLYLHADAASPVRGGHPNMHLENRIWKDKTSKTNSILTIFYDKISGSMGGNDHGTRTSTNQRVTLGAAGTLKEEPETVKQRRAQGGCLGTESR